MSLNESKALAALKELIKDDGANLQEPGDAMAIARNFGVIMTTLSPFLESQPVAETVSMDGFTRAQVKGALEELADRLSARLVNQKTARDLAKQVYATLQPLSPQPVAGQVIGEAVEETVVCKHCGHDVGKHSTIDAHCPDDIGGLPTWAKTRFQRFVVYPAQQPQAQAVEVVSEEWVESWLLRETNEFAGFGMDDEDFHQFAKIVHALLASRQGRA